LKLNPEQVNVICPAATSCFTSRTTILLAASPLLSVTDLVVGVGTTKSQLTVEDAALIKLDGNVKVIFPLAATVRADDVLKEKVAD